MIDNNDDDDDDDKIIEDINISFKKTCFYIIEKVTRKSGVYTRVIMNNRWSWMTDNKLRPLYPPISEFLKEKKDFKYKGKGVMETKMEEEECRTYLLSLGMIENKTMLIAKNQILDIK